MASHRCELAQGLLWVLPLAPAELEAFVATHPESAGSACSSPAHPVDRLEEERDRAAGRPVAKRWTAGQDHSA